jgi:hypothetical protein
MALVAGAPPDWFTCQFCDLGRFCAEILAFSIGVGVRYSKRLAFRARQPLSCRSPDFREFRVSAIQTTPAHSIIGRSFYHHVARAPGIGLLQQVKFRTNALLILGEWLKAKRTAWPRLSPGFVSPASRFPRRPDARGHHA